MNNFFFFYRTCLLGTHFFGKFANEGQDLKICIFVGGSLVKWLGWNQLNVWLILKMNMEKCEEKKKLQKKCNMVPDMFIGNVRSFVCVCVPNNLPLFANISLSFDIPVPLLSLGTFCGVARKFPPSKYDKNFNQKMCFANNQKLSIAELFQDNENRKNRKKLAWTTKMPFLI